MKYAYPAIFTPDNTGYSIRFPDVEGCYTSADTLVEGLEMASDALCLMLYDMEENGEAIPAASSVKDVEAQEREIVTLVACDTVEYRKFHENRAVKKTLTIPAWLNTMAERAGVNFSMTLQTALKQELNIH